MNLYPVIKKLRMSGACLEPVHVHNPVKRLRWSFFRVNGQRLQRKKVHVGCVAPF